MFGSVGQQGRDVLYAFGDTDLFVIADASGSVTAAAPSLVINTAGAATAKITVLLTVEEIDIAAKKAAAYRPPGQ